MAIGDGHELDRAHTRLEVLGGQAIDRATACRGEHALEGFERLGDADDIAGDTEHAGKLLRVAQRCVTRIGAGLGDAMHVGGTERVDGNRGHDGGIDAAGHADDDVGEAILMHVIARRDDERTPDDFADVEFDGGALLHLMDSSWCGVEDEEVLLVDGRGMHEAAIGSRDRGVSGEDDRIGCAALVGAHDVRTAVTCECGEVAQVAAGGGGSHRVAEGVVVHLDEHVDVGKLGARLEVAVEEHGDVAIGKLDDGDDVAFEQCGRAERFERAVAGEEELGNDGERVGVKLVDARAGDERGDGRDIGKGAQVLVRVLDKGGRIDQSADVSASERACTKDDEVGVRRRCLTGVVEHLVHVARQIADAWIYLCDCNAHTFPLR